MDASVVGIYGRRRPMSALCRQLSFRRYGPQRRLREREIGRKKRTRHALTYGFATSRISDAGGSVAESDQC
jgi:hypothetical protein